MTTAGEAVLTLLVRLIGLACISSTTASAAITLPLEGYYKHGRYFPIQIDGADASREQHFTAQGCVSTDMQAGTGSPRIVPMLVTGSPISLALKNAPALPLHLIGDQQRLIATTGTDVSIAATLFPDARLIPIRLDPADPLPGPAVAYESLDAILLDAADFSRITDAQRSTLLAGSVTLIAVGDSLPDSRWPWHRRGRVWVLSHIHAGPSGGVINEDAFTPTYTWTPGRSSTVRGQVMGAAALFVLLTIGLTLFPRRWTLWTCVVFSLAASAGIYTWRRSLGAVTTGGGDILIASSGLLQRDQWVFERAHETARRLTPWTGSTHPFFYSRLALDRANLKLELSSNGELGFQYDAALDNTAAFLRRAVTPGDLPSTTTPILSPMADLAKTTYLRPGDRLAGESPGRDGRWNSVVISRENAPHTP